MIRQNREIQDDTIQVNTTQGKLSQATRTKYKLMQDNII